MGLARYKKLVKKNILKTFKKSVFKYYYKEFISAIILENSGNIFLQSTSNTLNEIEECLIQNKSGAYMRFGDGDVFLLNNMKDAYQNADSLLAKEMLEAFQIKSNNVFKSLAIHSEEFGYEEGMSWGNHRNTDKLAINLIEATFTYFIGQKIYSPVALHFIASQEPIRANLFLKLLKSKTKLFVGNEKLKDKTVSMLFGDSLHIKTPSENAYDQIDRIFFESKMEIEKFTGFAVVVLAMGCSGRPLMKRLIFEKFNIFLFDFGSLIDGLDGVKNRTWLKIANINYEILTKDLDCNIN